MQKNIIINIQKGFQKSGSIGLLSANLLTIVLMILFKESLLFVLWVYWFQSLILSFATVIMLFRTPRFQSEKGDSMDVNSRGGKLTLGIFLLFIILTFHGVYALFMSFALPLMLKQPAVKFLHFLVPALIFLLHYVYQSLRNHTPYAEMPTASSFVKRFILQILPIHFTIIASGFVFNILSSLQFETAVNLIVLIIFQLVKSISELILLGKIEND